MLSRVNVHLFLWADGALVVGALPPLPPHRHHAIELIVGVDTELEVEPACPGPGRPRAVACAPSHLHRVSARSGDLLALYLEAHRTPYARWAQSIGLGPEAAVRAVGLPPAALQSARRLRDERSAAAADAFLCAALGSAPSYRGEALVAMDFRVRRALDAVRANVSRHTRVTSLAASVGLSSSRFAHLFREALGIPARRFLRWERTRAALEAAAGGSPLTAAAQDAGFADSSHLAHAFREMLGICGSLLRTPFDLKVVRLPAAPGGSIPADSHKLPAASEG